MFCKSCCFSFVSMSLSSNNECEVPTKKPCWADWEEFSLVQMDINSFMWNFSVSTILLLVSETSPFRLLGCQVCFFFSLRYKNFAAKKKFSLLGFRKGKLKKCIFVPLLLFFIYKLFFKAFFRGSLISCFARETYFEAF